VRLRVQPGLWCALRLRPCRSYGAGGGTGVRLRRCTCRRCESLCAAAPVLPCPCHRSSVWWQAVRQLHTRLCDREESR